MKGWQIILITTLLTGIVLGDLCTDTVQPGESCTMLTPVLRCANYNYTVYNTTAEIEEGGLIGVDDGIYKFTFNYTEGDYIVRLCDNSTREIGVHATGGSSIMMALLVVLLMGVLAYIAFNLDDVHVALKIGLFLLIFGLLPFTFTLASKMITLAYGTGTTATALVGTLERIGGLFTYITWIIFAYFVIFIIWSIMSWAKSTAEDTDKDNATTIKNEGKGDMQW